MNDALSAFSLELLQLTESSSVRTLTPPLGRDCSSNNYLGLANHPQIIEATKKALNTLGFGSTASRLIRGDRALTHEIEAKIARFKRTESALYFATGYGANLGLLQSVIKPDDVVFSDELNHASLIDGLRLSKAHCHIFNHLDINHLLFLIQNSPPQKRRWLVTESLFSMDGDIAPLNRYAEVSQKYALGLIVDEAHAFGLYGKNQSGLIEQSGIFEAVFASSNATGKALGCFGSFICAKKIVIDYLIQKARPLIFSTASPPCLLAAIDAALTLVQTENYRQKKLFSNIELFSDLLDKNGILNKRPFLSPIFPIICGENQKALKAAQFLQSEGFDVRAIRPPTVPPNTARLRIAIHADMTEHEIIHLCKLLGSI